jgi:hypothetical protein
MTDQAKCTQCGAALRPQADGRTLGCDFCGAQVQVAVDGGQVAAGLHLDLSNAGAFLAKLAQDLHPHFGERSRLEMEGSRVRLFELHLDPDVFLARHEPQGIVAQHRKLVRGIALKTATHPLDHWVELLSRSLANYANENARVAHVLARLRTE